ncbi:alpha-glucosidase [Paenibacillus sp. URB8-2]|uniref:alpha-glucosidase n=1 Tax=Paenibacillus sp. URB8-2 TaxID=2741301 RepID=UPI0015C19389|nr:alpha-glucosidase [Paenibacillus sp. URB8-2]BCG58580.1 oligo-1,6-glucosidase [Paenibacillus sp. URB8-2]
MENRDRNWWKESVVYQIYPRSFQDSGGDGIGDLRGIINRLGYLSDLGIDVIWVCPVYDSPNDDNGYDIRDFYKMQAEYGTMEDMLELIAKAEARGIRIIMDLVANHTSDEHAWFVESRSSKDNPKRDWYIWKPGSGGEEPTNWESNFGGSAWEYDETTQEYYLHCFSRKQPDLNWENPEVRRNIFSMMEWWIDKGIAGFRIDAITFIKKNQQFPQLKTEDSRRYAPLAEASLNQPGILDFLHEMKREVLEPRNVMSVAEAPGVPIEQIHDYVDEQSGVFNMIFQFDHVDLDVKPMARGIYHPWKLTDFKHALSKWQRETANKGWMALFMENHDHVRSVSKFGCDGPFREESAKMLAAYYFLMRGTPFIYQGQEIGMTNHYFASIEEYRDIESINFHSYETVLGRPEADIMEHLAKRSRDQGRMPMQWSPEPMAGFTTGEPWLPMNPNYSSINVEQSLRDDNSILHFYRKLIRLRRENKALIYGGYREIYTDSEELAGYVRALGNEEWTVLCNFTDRSITLAEPVAGSIILSNLKEHNNGILKPYETLICKAE